MEHPANKLEGTQLHLPFFVPSAIEDPAWSNPTAPEQTDTVREQVFNDTCMPLEQRDCVREQVTSNTNNFAPEHKCDDRWNPSDFGEVPHKIDSDGQLCVFWDESDEPPEPDDYESEVEWESAWCQWKSVRETVASNTEDLTRDRIAPEHTHTVCEAVPQNTQECLQSSDCVREQVSKNTDNFAPEHTHWTEDYWVKRRGKKYYYSRYVWMERRKLHHVHIGSSKYPKVAAKICEVRTAIALGKSPSEIKQLIERREE